MSFRKTLVLYLNELWIIVLASIIGGAFIYSAISQELPCPLCLLQRLGMIATAIGPLLNLFFGVRGIHYGYSVLGLVFGASVSIRQILLHICPGSGSYGGSVFGFQLYTWAFLVACCSLLGVAFLLMLSEKKEEFREPQPLQPLAYFAIGYLSLIVLANVVATFLECGFGFCPDNPVQMRY